MHTLTLRSFWRFAWIPPPRLIAAHRATPRAALSRDIRVGMLAAAMDTLRAPDKGHQHEARKLQDARP
jgi:hypothetical protein